LARGSVCFFVKNLRRLNTDYVDILLLHSPSPEVITAGDAMHSLERIRYSGKTRKIGVSCDDVSSALLALDDARVEAIELPLWPWTSLSNRVLEQAKRQQVFVIARGLISALRSDRQDRRPLGTALVSALSMPGIDRLIIGTTRVKHLSEILDVLQNTEEISVNRS
jgi:aryl-alcohol dehydrogenase-like predicted oxidoreductase